METYLLIWKLKSEKRKNNQLMSLLGYLTIEFYCFFSSYRYVKPFLINSVAVFNYGRTPLWHTPTSLLRTVVFVPGASPCIFSKFNLPDTDTERHPPYGKSSSLMQTTINCLLSVIDLSIFKVGKKPSAKSTSNSSEPYTSPREGWIVDANFRLFWHQSGYAESDF